MRTARFTAIPLSLMLGACMAPAPKTTPDPPSAIVEEQIEPPAAALEAPESENDRIAAFFEQVFAGSVSRSPERQSYLGIKRDQSRWDERTEEHESQELQIARGNLARLRAEFHFQELDEQARLSYRLFEELAIRDIEGYRWRQHRYPITPLGGVHSGIPAFLINIHRVDTVADAQAYIERLRGVPRLIDQTIAQLETSAKAGVVFPRFGYPQIIETAMNVISGAPFDQGEDSTLLADFRTKTEALDIDQAERDRLLAAAVVAMTESLQPAYLDLVAYLESLEARAGDDPGVWRLPEGDAYYAWTLRRYTTTDMSADEIHEAGLSEVARIQAEMLPLMAQLGFDGSLAEFFAFMREDPRFYLPETDESRDRYLEQARAVITDMESRLPALFRLRPEADLVVKRVEPFREATAGRAFYESPAADGSRPGTYYVNLHRMADMPVYQLEALAYHEGIPGHHMQVAIAYEMEDLPRFRRYARFSAYTEGWGLYAELLPKEIGLYTDPYQDLGRLAAELWRACRLVVDTGIHHNRWAREEAVAYLIANTPNPVGDIRRAVDRYISWPGQATAYTVGMLRILALRQRASEALGEDFDIRDFHDIVLGSGPLPIRLLEQRVEDWLSVSVASRPIPGA